ncbi:MAG: hypothetical protein ABI693_26035 [Bryobacteraceae bacterium]
MNEGSDGVPAAGANIAEHNPALTSPDFAAIHEQQLRIEQKQSSGLSEPLQSLKNRGDQPNECLIGFEVAIVQFGWTSLAIDLGQRSTMTCEC